MENMVTAIDSNSTSTPTESGEGVRRREFLQWTTIGTVGLSAFVSGVWSPWEGVLIEAEVAEPFDSCPRHAFDDDEHTFKTLAWMTEQFVPGREHGERDAGALESCLVSFLGLAAFDPETKGFFQDGVQALDAESQTTKGSLFRDLSFEDQTDVLSNVQTGGTPFLQAFFSTVLLLTKVAWVNNFPENVYRVAGQPVLTDERHLITDPNTSKTDTGWDVLDIHAITWQVEQLMWQWQAGVKVLSQDGLPIPVGSPLSIGQRLAARERLRELSDQGRF